MQKLIIDTDPGIDDALALLLALAAKDELDVTAITTVNGNVGVDQVTENVFRILDVAGRSDIPVYKGNGKPLMRENDNCEEFHGDDGLGNLGFKEVPGTVKEESAVDFLIRKVREEKGEITLVPIGPLTNIAQAVQKDPEFARNVKEVVIMGGAEHGGNMSPCAEFNFWTDPEAAKIVFQAGFERVTMVGLDATSYVFLSPTLRELLYLINTPVSRFIHKITRVYADGHWEIEKKLGCELCDVLTIAYLLDRNVVEKVDAFVDVETSGLCDGMSVVYRTKYYPDKKKNCEVAVKADTKRFFEIFFGYLFPEYMDEARELI
ncbi:MAG TPA: nucleoside hydrolase [Candidatus Dorea merdavium]|nr:nucleoside hydrolase [Candidatus Dorea merdavium]